MAYDVVYIVEGLVEICLVDCQAGMNFASQSYTDCRVAAADCGFVLYLFRTRSFHGMEMARHRGIVNSNITEKATKAVCVRPLKIRAMVVTRVNIDKKKGVFI